LHSIPASFASSATGVGKIYASPRTCPSIRPARSSFIGEDKVSAPIRIYHGVADDYTPIAACREYVERVSRTGVDAKLYEFPDARHGFDAPALPPMLLLPRVQNSSRCRLLEEAPGVIVDAATRQPASGRDSCVTYGATVGYDPRAHRAAIAAVKES
jgi:dienelactone hydrolase